MCVAAVELATSLFKIIGLVGYVTFRHISKHRMLLRGRMPRTVFQSNAQFIASVARDERAQDKSRNKIIHQCRTIWRLLYEDCWHAITRNARSCVPLVAKLGAHAYDVR